MTKTADLIERLETKGREEAEFWEQDPNSHDLVKAARLIASLQEEVERLKGELTINDAAIMIRRDDLPVGKCRLCDCDLFRNSNREDSSEGLRCWPECPAARSALSPKKSIKRRL